jgi:hypothetical protein
MSELKSHDYLRSYYEIFLKMLKKLYVLWDNSSRIKYLPFLLFFYFWPVYLKCFLKYIFNLFFF